MSADRKHLAAALTPFEPDELDRQAATIYAVDDDFRLTFVNRAWRDFAKANGASWSVGEWDIGRCVLDAVPEAARDAFRHAFRRARATGHPVDVDYACPSPALDRDFCMRVYPLTRGGFLTVHAPVREAPAVRDTTEVIGEDGYRNAQGFVVMCANCRRTRHGDAEESRWHWVPSFAFSTPTRTSHGLCEPCAAHYFPP